MKLSTNRGFTLIELMIVVAILAILSAIALPIYQDQVSRSQTAGALSDARGGVTGFEELIQRGLAGNFNAVAASPQAAVGLEPSTTRCSSITVNDDDNGFIECTIEGNPRVNGKFIKLVRDPNTSEWSCEADTGIDPKYHPDGCS